MTYDVGNLGPGLRQAQKCGGVKPGNGIPNPLLLIKGFQRQMLCGSLFVPFLSFDLRFLITPLISSNFLNKIQTTSFFPPRNCTG